ncbi:hypothetical protein [Streptomyces sp. DH37]|uniref:hypothetical protein n=1 Tax=Streptomyces sp. DH37 TaxID=3040122 RepID=UPI0024426ABD|nr:hypothetical protein [Streptomyces sp. DH37]MDG9703882.1 hypothetical protein [Streptomyces sp. DH37]
MERVAEPERMRVEPAAVDLAQVLLRVTSTADEQVRRAAGDLQPDAGRRTPDAGRRTTADGRRPTADGRRLARWLREGGLPHQDSTPEKWPAADPAGAPPGRWEPAHLGPDRDIPPPPVAAVVFGPYERDRSP